MPHMFYSTIFQWGKVVAVSALFYVHNTWSPTPSDNIQPRIHAFGDLKAYVCTLGGAECDAELFEDRDTWFEHELRKHRCEYMCTLCSHGPFSFERIAAHIQNIHGRFSDRQLQMLREGGRQNSIQFKSEDCPFCDEWTQALSTKTSLIGKEVDPT